LRELSLHILDIVTNSIEAGATRVIICIDESARSNTLRIRIKDNGRGMSRELIERVLDPFVTTRTTRPVGLGLSLLYQAATDCEGSMKISSVLGKETLVDVMFKLNSLNRMPLGEIGETLANICIASPDIHFFYRHITDSGRFAFDSFWYLVQMIEQNCSMPQLAGVSSRFISTGIFSISSIS
jgi:hypothetical protein